MSLKVNLAQIKTISTNIRYNTEKIIEAIHRAKAENADIIVFPELAISGYGAADYLLNEGFIDKVQLALKIIMNESQNITVIVGYPEAVKQSIYSSAAIIQNGKLLGNHRKMLLPTSELFPENYYLDTGNSPTTIRIKGTKIGIAISEDILDYKALPQCDLLLISAAFNWSYTKADEKDSIIQEVVSTIKTPTIFVNAFASTDRLIFSGNSAVFNKKGQPIARLQRFQENQLTFNLDSLDQAYRLSNNPLRGQEALYEALKFSLKEYLLKIEKERVIISVTRHIDSQLLLSLAVDSVGAHNVVALLFNPQDFLPSESRQIQNLCAQLNIELREKIVDSEDIIHLSRVFNIPEQQQDRWIDDLKEKIQNALLLNYASTINACPLGHLNKTRLALDPKLSENSSLSYYMPFFDLYHGDIVALTEYRNIISPLFNRDTIAKEKERTIRHPLVPVMELKLSVVDDIIYRYIERHESLEYISKQYDDSEMVKSLIILIRKIKLQQNQNIIGPLVASRTLSRDWHFPHLTVNLNEISLG